MRYAPLQWTVRVRNFRTPNDIPPEQEMRQLPESRYIESGAYGRVYRQKGKAYKYGDIEPEEYRIAKLAAEWGIGPAVYEYQDKVYTVRRKGNKATPPVAAMAMEWLEEYQPGYLWLSSSKEKKAKNHWRTIQTLRRGIEKLAELHLHGIAHGDYHLANFMVNPKGQVKIIDFGMAKEGWDAVIEEILKTWTITVSSSGSATSDLANLGWQLIQALEKQRLPSWANRLKQHFQTFLLEWSDGLLANQKVVWVQRFYQYLLPILRQLRFLPFQKGLRQVLAPLGRKPQKEAIPLSFLPPEWTPVASAKLEDWVKMKVLQAKG